MAFDVLRRTLPVSGGAPAPDPNPEPDPDEPWAPTPSAELTATIAAIGDAPGGGYVFVPQVGGMEVTPGGGVVPTNGDPVGRWLDATEPTRGLTARPAGLRPAWNATEGAVAFDQPSGLGKALFFPQDITATKWHIVMCIKGTDFTKTLEQCILQIPALRLLSNVGSTYGLTVQVISGGVFYYDIASGTVSDYTLVELRRDGSTLQVRTNGMNWTTHSVSGWADWSQQGDAVDDPNRSMLGRASYTDATYVDYLSWDGLVNGCVVMIGDWFADIDATEARKTAAAGQTVANLEPADPTPPPPPAPDPTGEPGANGTATNNVSTYNQLASAAAAAEAGTIIEVANGTYSGSRINVSNSGTVDNPIVIRAANILGANVPGGFNLTGSHIIVRGFDFNANVEGTDRVVIAGTGNQVWRCRFRYNGGQNNLRFMAGNGGRAMYCAFTVVDPNNDYAPSSRHLGGCIGGANLHYNAEVGFCYFYDLLSKPAGEPYSTRARSAIGLNNANNNSGVKVNWRIHHCLLENCGNSRLNVKMSGNTVEYCTITGKTGTNVSYSTDFNQRFGEDNVWRGCWSENADGFRVQGNRNKYISCKSVNSTALDVAVGDHDAPPWLASNPRANDTKLTACELTVRVGGMGWAGPLPARNTRIENHQGSVSLVSGNHTGTVQTGEMTETPVTPIKILPAMVGPTGTGV